MYTTCSFLPTHTLLLHNAPTQPSRHTGGTLRVYTLTKAGTRLSLLHTTPVDGIPGALTPFKGRVLVGVDNTVRLYECGKRKLLRKSEYRKYVLGCE